MSQVQPVQVGDKVQYVGVEHAPPAPDVSGQKPPERHPHDVAPVIHPAEVLAVHENGTIDLRYVNASRRHERHRGEVIRVDDVRESDGKTPHTWHRD